MSVLCEVQLLRTDSPEFRNDAYLERKDFYFDVGQPNCWNYFWPNANWYHITWLMPAPRDWGQNIDYVDKKSETFY
ncbi:hypothetical protein CDAR_228421 [Caerostris darwini]|uniref:Uncharacterized protein n=1 Tax=Caerostris darwini TaxID=1538125 RepID=A0AAV4N5P8_9ARAC|nr:hypothetical protein CDAR_228421 [Caerostris darwini]